MKLLNIQLALNSIKHLKEKSCYNHNYTTFQPALLGIAAQGFLFYNFLYEGIF